MREKSVETYLRAQIMKAHGLCYKWISENGVPDRIALWPDEIIDFIETKTDVGKLSPIQIWQHKRLRKLGFKVYVIRTKIEVIEYVNSRKFPPLSKGGTKTRH